MCLKLLPHKFLWNMMPVEGSGMDVLILLRRCWNIHGCLFIAISLFHHYFQSHLTMAASVIWLFTCYRTITKTAICLTQRGMNKMTFINAFYWTKSYFFIQISLNFVPGHIICNLTICLDKALSPNSRQTNAQTIDGQGKYHHLTQVN